jgi:hypothetical protein
VISLETPRCRNLLLCSVVAVALVAAVVVGSARAATTTPCWKQVLGEWYTGDISTIFAHDCYTEAIAHLPSNSQEYSSAAQDIEQAEAQAARGKPYRNPGGPITTTESNPPKGGGGIHHLLNELTPGNPQAFPLPLLVLGALAILLVIAGGVGMLWQRRHPGGPDEPDAP